MYEVSYASQRIGTFLNGLSKKLRRQIVKDIERKLPGFNHRTAGIKYIKVMGQYRLRCGDFRVFFVVEKSTIRVLNICNRKDTPYS